MQQAVHFIYRFAVLLPDALGIQPSEDGRQIVLELGTQQRNGFAYQRMPPLPHVFEKDVFSLLHGHLELALSTQCRSGGSAAPANTDILAKVWKKDGSGNKSLLATSTNYQQHNVGQTLRWVFAPFEVASGDMLLVTFHTNDYADGTQYAAGHQCCFAVTSTSEPESGCIGGDGQWQYTNLIPLYTWEIQVRHAADFISHLTSEEHAGLAQLLARKDELLALLS